MKEKFCWLPNPRFQARQSFAGAMRFDVDIDTNFDFNQSDHSHINLTLGHKLKVLRESFGLSQRELAKKAGVTNSNISMIEQGQVSPSIHSLHKILDAFPISLAEFFSCNLLTAQSPVIPANSIKAYLTPDGIKVQELAPSNQVPGLTRHVFPPGVANSMQSAKFDILGWVLNGELQLQVATQYFSLKMHDAFHIRQGQVFCFANHRSNEAEILLASAM